MAFRQAYALALVTLASLVAVSGPAAALSDDPHGTEPPSEIGAEFSGQWYNPDQSGHGLLLEVLPGGRAFGAWFVFDDAGNPYWLVGTGEMSGAEMRLEMLSLSGGRFPPHFNAANVERIDWGTVTLHFESCSEATVAWDSRLPAFGTGLLSMTRLTSIDGLPCGEAARWKADLDTMVKGVLDGHPDPFHQLPRESFEARLAALRQRLSGLPAGQVPVAFAELLAGLGDSHTAIFLHGGGMRRFPVELSRVREGLIVTAAHDGFEDLLGHMLVAIDGVSAETIEVSLQRIISHENQAWVEALTTDYMMIPEILAYLGHIGSADHAMFRFQSLGGDILRRDIESMPADASLNWHSIFNRPEYTAPMHLRHDDNYWYEYMRDTRTIYLAYRRARNMHGMPFDDMIRRMEMFIQRHPVDRLILDLRFNTGGDSSILQPLIDGLLNSPFNDPDRLFVLVGRHTFSSGLINAFELSERTEATFIGGPTGGKPDHFGETRRFALEHTEMTVTHSTRFFNLMDDPSILSFDPDVHVDDPYWRDYLEGRDPCIAAAGGS